MIRFNPRVWGFSDYPKEIIQKVPPQTEKEKNLARIIYIPFLLFGLGFPIISTLILENQIYEGRIDFIGAFLNIFIILMFGNIFDLIILDLIIVGTITPKFVIIKGTEEMKDAEYKDFRISHAIAHLKGTILLAFISIAIALILWFF